MTASIEEGRPARLRAALAAAPFDAVVLTTPESVHYATGYLFTSLDRSLRPLPGGST